MRFKPYIWIVGITIVILLAFKWTSFGDEEWLDTPTDTGDSTQIVFDIESGDSGRTVAKNLKKEGFINSWLSFYVYLKNNDLGGSVQAGRFVLTRDMTPTEIAEAITSGAGQMAVTIPEGYTISQIDDKLFEMGLIEDDEFKTCTENCEFHREWGLMSGYSSLEGYLFPDTYFVDPNTFEPSIFIVRLLDTFDQKVLTDENITAIEASGRTLDEIVIAASIIEKEVISEEDRAIVSGIFWKRYDNNWVLGMCSTVNYITGESEITYDDLQIDSEYNTRKYPGLPPTAISNPGLSSIEAALYPQDSPYWYFLTAAETGETIYATTNDEHNVNKARYL